jgi:hypothetical protein
MKTLTRNQAKDFIRSLGNKIFGARFFKKNGDERVMSARLNVTKHLKGGEKPYDPDDYNLITVFDCNKEGYRMIPVDRLEEINANGQAYKVIEQ